MSATDCLCGSPGLTDADLDAAVKPLPEWSTRHAEPKQPDVRRAAEISLRTGMFDRMILWEHPASGEWSLDLDVDCRRLKAGSMEEAIAVALPALIAQTEEALRVMKAIQARG